MSEFWTNHKILSIAYICEILIVLDVLKDGHPIYEC